MTKKHIHNRTTFTGTCTGDDNDVNPSSQGNLVTGDYVDWELNVVERRPNDTDASDYGSAYTQAAGGSASGKIDPDDALQIMNRAARAIHHILGSTNWSETRIPKIILTIECKHPAGV